MQVFKAFYKITLKNLPAAIIYFIIFFVIILAFGATSQKEIDSKFQAKELDICIIDEDQSTASRLLSDHLGSMHNLIELENDRELLCDYLYYRFVNYILFIPEGFEENLISGHADGLLTNMKVPGSTNGQFVDNQIDAYLSSVHTCMIGGYSMEEAFAKTNEILKNTPEVEMLSFDAQKNTSDNKKIFNTFQFLPYVLISLLICGVAPNLITFRKSGIQERIRCSALQNRRFTIQLAGGCLSFSFLIFGTLILLCALIFRDQTWTAFTMLGILNGIVFLLFAIGLTLLVSNFILPSNGLNMIANIVGLGMSFLGGVFVPQNMLSDQILAVSRFLPTYWYSRINNMLAGVSDEPFTFTAYWQYIGMELLFAATVFVLALLASGYRKQKSLST